MSKELFMDANGKISSPKIIGFLTNLLNINWINILIHSRIIESKFNHH